MSKDRMVDGDLVDNNELRIKDATKIGSEYSVRFVCVSTVWYYRLYYLVSNPFRYLFWGVLKW